MDNYKKLYSKMFNAITDTIERLKQIQLEAEEDYIKLHENTGESKKLHVENN